MSGNSCVKQPEPAQISPPLKQPATCLLFIAFSVSCEALYNDIVDMIMVLMELVDSAGLFGVCIAGNGKQKWLAPPGRNLQSSAL